MWFWPKKGKVTLTCMRLAEMFRVHPNQIERECSKCGAVVGIYPSGQHVIKNNPGTVIVCNHCGPGGILAPGGEDEPQQSKWRWK